MTQASNLAKGGSNFNSTGNLSLTTGVTGTLPVANGGTGGTTSTGSGALVLATSPTLVTPVLGTPASGTLTNCTGLPNAGLVNSSVTVNSTAISLGGSGTITAVNPNALTIGTGLSGTSYNGSAAVTIANSGVTSIVAGTGISVSGATGAVTVTASGGGVTSLNGATGAITNTGSGDIGSYTAGIVQGQNVSTTRGATIAGSSLNVIATNTNDNGTTPFDMRYRGSTYTYTTPFSGTWRAMNFSKNEPTQCCGNYLRAPNLWVRIS